jgi:uncharacterized damage-inducible protein DinB
VAINIGPYPAFFGNYIRLVDADSVADAGERYSTEIIEFFKNIPNEKAAYRYEANKWSLKELLLHVTDTERIFAYRALRISRKDKTPLPGFDENSFAAASNADARTWESILNEYIAVRTSTDLLLASFTEEQLNQVGLTNNQQVSTRAICFIIYGHILHHINIVKERYGV